MRPGKRITTWLAGLASCLILLAGCQPDRDPERSVHAPPEISVSDSWMRAAPPTAKVLAGYLVIDNPTTRPAALIGATSPLAGAVEIHETVVADGLARMERRDRLEVPPGGRLVLEPGGAHLMFMQPSMVPAEGEFVPVDLQFDSGKRVTVDLEVRAGPSDGGHEHHHHHESGQG